MLQAAAIKLSGVEDTSVGQLRLRCRPGREANGGVPLLVFLSTNESLVGTATLALLEDSEYLYELDLDNPVGSVAIDPVELFDADDETGVTGRLRPGLYTGVLTVRASHEGRFIGNCELEIRSRKLGYLDDYRSMLSSIAQEGAELLLQRFAPTAITSLVPGPDADAKTLYQRFAFLKSFLEDPSFVAAIASILGRPHESFDPDQETRPPGRGAPGGSSFVRQLVRPGPRVPLPAAIGHLNHVPKAIVVERFSATFDTEPNRFVRMAFETWRATCVELREALARQSSSGPVHRGVGEVDRVIDELDQVLASAMLRAAGRLTRFPVANQVLQKREGYRDVMRVFVQGEAAARLRWEGSEDVFRAGQRDVATLYEYWCYMQLARIVEGICDEGFDRGQLFELSEDRTVLGLRRGRQQALRGEALRRGRRLDIELWFNRTFGTESWSREMRPDCSLRITLKPSYQRTADSIWLHFDAKYRVKRGSDVMALAGDESGEDGKRLTSRRADLLKMHAYRDAIRRSAGAYVLYPGNDVQTNMRQAYEEVLPGIGAFPFRVGLDGNADSASVGEVRSFLEQVLDHAANQGSSYERSRYWTDRSYEEGPSTVVDPQTFLLRPPADTVVLLGYVRDEDHLVWILEHQLYNLRADERTGSVGRDPSLLRAELVALYGPALVDAIVLRRIGPPQLLTMENLLELGYPAPRGLLYCCMQVEVVLLEDRYISIEQVRSVLERIRPGAAIGEPIVVTWADLAGSATV